MANIRRNIASPLSLGLGEIGVDRNKNVWLRVSDSEALHLSGVPGSMVRVIGGPGQRVVVPSANNISTSTTIKDAADLITNTTNFAGKLSTADTNVQLALDTLDDHVHVHSTNTSLTTDDHTQYALLLGRAGGQSLSGGTAANDDLTLQGTTNATRTTSYVLLQPNGGKVGLGISTPTAYLHLQGDASVNSTFPLWIDGYSADVNGPGFLCRAARGVIGNPTGVQTDDVLAGFTGRGYTTSGWGTINTGAIYIRAAQTFTASAQGTYLFFRTTPIGSTTAAEVLRITDFGRMGLKGITVPTAMLHLPAGTATASTAPLKLTSGVSLTSPEAGALEFTTDSLFFTITTGPTRKTLAFTTDITATKLDDFAAPDDNTDLNVSTSAHGLAPKLPNDAKKYLDGTGAYSVPVGIHYATLTSSGTDAYTVTVTNGPAQAAGVTLLFIPDVGCTGASTLNYNGTGAADIYLVAGGAFSNTKTGDIIAGGMIMVSFDGTRWVLMNGAIA